MSETKPKPPIDTGRRGVMASLIKFDGGTFYVGNVLHGPFGAFLDVEGLGPNNWIICCPGCGQATGPKDGASWTVAGSFDKIETLSLSPSLAMGCCGWHGYLRNGVFDPC